MTDLTAICPKCKTNTTNYKHFVDHFGIGLPHVPSGEYEMTCSPYYSNQKTDDFCGNKFRVRVINKQTVEVIK